MYVSSFFRVKGRLNTVKNVPEQGLTLRPGANQRFQLLCQLVGTTGREFEFRRETKKVAYLLQIFAHQHAIAPLYTRDLGVVNSHSLAEALER